MVTMIVLLTACGSDDSSSPPATAPTSVPATSPSTTSTTSATTTTKPPTTEATSTSSSTTSTTAPSVPTTTVAPTTTLDASTLAQQQYFYISSAYNQARTDVGNSFASPLPWSDYPAFCAQMAAIEEQFAHDVAAYDWPAEADDEANALAATSAAVAGNLYECSHREGTRAAQQPLLDAYDAAAQSASDAASAMRVAIGLPIDR